MATFLSTEIRWFIPGKIPIPVYEWFHQGNLWQPDEKRIDTYLLLTHAQTVGVKFREGRFEVKALIEEHGGWNPSQGVTGVIQSWEKWSKDSMGSKNIMEGNWINVEKRRTVRVFELGKGGIMEVPARNEVSIGCQAELTQVKCNQSDYWSISLEAFGNGLQQVIKDVAAHMYLPAIDQGVFKGHNVFSSVQSMSYPSFLIKISDSE